MYSAVATRKLTICRQHKLKTHETLTKDNMRKFNRSLSDEYGANTVLGTLQPIPAIVAIVGCIVTFAFCSATWWRQPVTFPKFVIAYAAQVIVLVIFAVLKLMRWLRTNKGTRDRKRPLDDVFEDIVFSLEMKIENPRSDKARNGDSERGDNDSGVFESGTPLQPHTETGEQVRSAGHIRDV